MNKRNNDLFENNINNINNIKKINIEFYTILKKNGFIVDNDFDEKKYILIKRTQQKFSTNNYLIIINPTLNCNLNCWYCYENHIENSEISDETICNFKKHLIVKYKKEPFSSLNLSFFGGEPLLKTKKVLDLISYSKKFCSEKNVFFEIGFTTNGTVISDDFLNSIKNIKTSFQITFDGDKEKHDKTRFFKKTDIGSFDKITLNIKKIQDIIKKHHIIIRINYDKETLKNIDELINSLSFIDKNKTTVNLQKVWQVEEKIDSDEFINVINKFLDNGFIVDYSNLSRKNQTCYADIYNTLLINYNGNIYKCTSKDFVKKYVEGNLLKNGQIKWINKNFINRLSSELPSICKDCNLLPSCSGFCSQQLLENKEFECVLKNLEISYEDFIAYNFKRNMILQKINKKELKEV